MKLLQWTAQYVKKRKKKKKILNEVSHLQSFITFDLNLHLHSHQFPHKKLSSKLTS